jgi:hypothetical protein
MPSLQFIFHEVCTGTVRTKEQSKRRVCNLIPIMVLNDRPTCKDRRAAELILARSTRLHQKPNTLPQTCLLYRTEPCSHAADHTFSVRTSASDPAPHSAASLETGLSDLRLQVNARSKADFGGASPQRLDFLGLENDIKRSETHHLDFTVFEAWAITTTSLIVQSGVAPARPATRAPNAFAKLAACDMGHPRS